MNHFKWLALAIALWACAERDGGAPATARSPALEKAANAQGAEPPADAPAQAPRTGPAPASLIVDPEPRRPNRAELKREKAGYRGEDVPRAEPAEAPPAALEVGELLIEEEEKKADKLGSPEKPRDFKILTKEAMAGEDLAAEDEADDEDGQPPPPPQDTQTIVRGQADRVEAHLMDGDPAEGKDDGARNEEGRMGKQTAGRRLSDRRFAIGQETMRDQTRAARPDVGLLDDGWLANQPAKPATFLPGFFYFENTYLGRSAHFIERLRRLDAAWGGGERPYQLAVLPEQPVDPPEDKGLSLSVALDRQWIDQPGRVYLQVTLQGSRRFGWRRPPLDVVVVVDGGAAARRPHAVVGVLERLFTTLGPQDRLGVVLAGEPPVVLAELGDLRDTRRSLGRLGGQARVGELGLRAAMEHAGWLLQSASQGQARVPGSQTVLVVADGSGTGAELAAHAAHHLTVQGATTSVIELGGDWGWWPVANAGHGNLHRVEGDDVAGAVDAELARISQVIARLLRVNIRLAPNVHAIRVLGSRKLDDEEVRQVKAREEATDRQLSATLGVKADRGADDDGIQTVIPFFYGGDAHVIAVELWVEKPGPVAEISLKYKDMVALENATARVGARIGSVPRPTTAAELTVRRNVRGFLLAETLDQAGRLVARGERAAAIDLLAGAEAGAGQDGALLTSFRNALERGDVAPEILSEALEFAGQRRISHVALR